MLFVGADPNAVDVADVAVRNPGELFAREVAVLARLLFLLLISPRAGVPAD